MCCTDSKIELAANASAPADANGFDFIAHNWIVQDELQNTYDACKEEACNFQP